MSCMRFSRQISITNRAAQLVGVRGFAIASGKGKKGPKGGANDAPKASLMSHEVKGAQHTTVVGANILQDGTDPKIVPDSEYPDWLWCLLDKRPTLSELRWKDSESLPFEDLKRFVKLDNRARIEGNNAARAKN
ncbi:unnamed protein product [Musa acuminata var. zebrina]